MKQLPIKDERVLTEQRMIQSNAYRILIYCLLISVIVQMYLMRAPFQQYAVELFSVGAMGVYGIICYLSKGLDPFGCEMTPKKMLLKSLLCGVVGVIFFVILSGDSTLKSMTLVFTLFVIPYFLRDTLLKRLVEKKQKQLEDALNQDEDSDD